MNRFGVVTTPASLMICAVETCDEADTTDACV
jgi:hypothetical protein